MAHPHHHQSVRKRIHKLEQPFPHPIRWMRVFDRIILIMGFMNTIATLPQVLEIYVQQEAAGVSTITWTYYTFFSLMLLIYGFIHKEIPIIVTYLGSVAMYALIVIGSIVY